MSNSTWMSWERVRIEVSWLGIWWLVILIIWFDRSGVGQLLVVRSIRVRVFIFWFIVPLTRQSDTVQYVRRGSGGFGEGREGSLCSKMASHQGEQAMYAQWLSCGGWHVPDCLSQGVHISSISYQFHRSWTWYIQWQSTPDVGIREGRNLCCSCILSGTKYDVWGTS